MDGPAQEPGAGERRMALLLGCEPDQAATWPMETIRRLVAIEIAHGEIELCRQIDLVLRQEDEAGRPQATNPAPAPGATRA